MKGIAKTAADDLVIPADFRRLAVGLPLVLLGGAVTVCILIVVFGKLVLSAHAVSAALDGSVRIGLFCALAFGYLRWIYVGRTRLLIDADSVTFRQPLSLWRVGWADIAAVEPISFLSPTHRGGVGAGVRVKLQAGGSRVIPDVLAVPRADLARLLSSRLRGVTRSADPV